MTTYDRVEDLAKGLGLTANRFAPYSTVQYRIGHLNPCGAGFRPLFTCVGCDAAMTWLRGFKAGMITQQEKRRDK